MKLNKNLLYSLAASALITVIIAAGIFQRPDKWDNSLSELLNPHVKTCPERVIKKATDYGDVINVDHSQWLYFCGYTQDSCEITSTDADISPARSSLRRDVLLSPYYFTVTDVMCGFAPSYQYRKPSRSTV